MWLHRFALLGALSIAVQCFTPSDRYTMSHRPSFAKYQALRKSLLAEHLGRALGSDVVLSEQEEQFNSMLMDLKTDELSRGFENPFNFTPSRHFFDVVHTVEASPLFKLIRKMPKGIFCIFKREKKRKQIFTARLCWLRLRSPFARYGNLWV